MNAVRQGGAGGLAMLAAAVSLCMHAVRGECSTPAPVVPHCWLWQPRTINGFKHTNATLLCHEPTTGAADTAAPPWSTEPIILNHTVPAAASGPAEGGLLLEAGVVPPSA